MMRLWKPLLLCGVACFVAACGTTSEPRGTPVPPVSVADTIERHAPQLMAIDGVVGVYEGRLADGTPCLKIMVVERTPELAARLPEMLDGHPVEIRETGPIAPRDTGR